MENLHIKTAEKIADALKCYLMQTSADYKKRYSEYLEAENKIRAVIKREESATFDVICKKINEKLTQELLHALFVTINPKLDDDFFMVNTEYVLRNGAILELRNRFRYTGSVPIKLIDEYENSHKGITSFYFVKAGECIKGFLDESSKYYC